MNSGVTKDVVGLWRPARPLPFHVETTRILLRLCSFWLALIGLNANGAELQAPDARDGRPKLELQTGHLVPVNHLAFTGDDRRLISSDFNGVLKFWAHKKLRSETLTVRHDSLVQKPGYSDLAQEPTGRWVALVGFINRKVLITDTLTGSLLQVLPESDGDL